MNPPTAAELRAALSALRDDAGKWDECAGTLNAAQSVADGSQIDGRHFSFIGDACGVTTAYENLRAKVATLLADGGKKTSGVADALREVATTYAEEEERGVHRMKEVW